MATADKKKAAAAIYAVVGSDESEVKRAAKELADKLTPPGADEFGVDIIDGRADNADQAATRIHQAVESLLTLPFFGGEKLVWLKSANFLGDSVLGRAASVLEALEKLGGTLSAGLPGDVKFLLSATEIDKRRSFFKSLGKLAKVEIFDKPDTSRSGWEEEAMRFAAEKARAKGLDFDADALELFALLTGGDSRQVDNELDKIDLYLGKERRNVRAGDVRLLVPLSKAGVIFELGNALAQRDVRLGLELTDQLLDQGESAIGILLVAIVPTARNLLVVKDLMQRHKLSKPQMPFHFTATLNRLPESAVQHLPRKKDGTVNGYALGIAACHAHRFQLAELPGLLEACLDANVKLVTSQLEERVILGELVAKFATRA
ncbi:MAG TPA: DNA polymerase III subunit delta [Chthoniobacteraceae bacterium]|nr:DNA polymerase III subunit delta [Chthoniobacteraceae bacterium]